MFIFFTKTSILEINLRVTGTPCVAWITIGTFYLDLKAKTLLFATFKLRISALDRTTNWRSSLFSKFYIHIIYINGFSYLSLLKWTFSKLNNGQNNRLVNKLYTSSSAARCRNYTVLEYYNNFECFALANFKCWNYILEILNKIDFTKVQIRTPPLAIFLIFKFLNAILNSAKNAHILKLGQNEICSFTRRRYSNMISTNFYWNRRLSYSLLKKCDYFRKIVSYHIFIIMKDFPIYPG